MTSFKPREFQFPNSRDKLRLSHECTEFDDFRPVHLFTISYLEFCWNDSGEDLPTYYAVNTEYYYRRDEALAAFETRKKSSDPRSAVSNRRLADVIPERYWTNRFRSLEYGFQWAVRRLQFRFFPIKGGVFVRGEAYYSDVFNLPTVHLGYASSLKVAREIIDDCVTITETPSSIYFVIRTSVYEQEKKPEHHDLWAIIDDKLVPARFDEHTFNDGLEQLDDVPLKDLRPFMKRFGNTSMAHRPQHIVEPTPYPKVKPKHVNVYRARYSERYTPECIREGDMCIALNTVSEIEQGVGISTDLGPDALLLNYNFAVFDTYVANFLIRNGNWQVDRTVDMERLYLRWIKSGCIGLGGQSSQCDILLDGQMPVAFILRYKPFVKWLKKNYPACYRSKFQQRQIAMRTSV